MTDLHYTRETSDGYQQHAYLTRNDKGVIEFTPELAHELLTADGWTLQ